MATSTSGSRVTADLGAALLPDSDRARDRRLLALAAVFVPTRAAALLSRLATDEVEGAREPKDFPAARRDRLEALSDQVAPRPAGEVAAALDAVIAAERARTARRAGSLCGGTPDRAALALRRLVLEGLVRSVGRPTDEGTSDEPAARAFRPS